MTQNLFTVVITDADGTDRAHRVFFRKEAAEQHADG